MAVPNIISDEGLTGLSAPSESLGSGRRERADGRRHCFHCGTACWGGRFAKGEKAFCCQGCLVVFELLMENGLGEFYTLAEPPGVRMKSQAGESPFSYLDEPIVRNRLVDFSDERITRVTLRIPAIHCVACVWLLENLFRLEPGVGESRVNFARQELAVSFENKRMKLSRLVALLAALGYEPDLNLSDLERRERFSINKSLWLQLGIAGFAFGNIMLFSISSYLGLDSVTGPRLQRAFGYFSLMLSLPVLIYSAESYWRSAVIGIRQRLLTIDVPIALGLAAIFAQSACEILSGRGEGYLDTLTGLIFFLLCGKWFQRKTYDRLVFDRDFRSFFPLSAMRIRGSSGLCSRSSSRALESRLSDDDLAIELEGNAGRQDVIGDLGKIQDETGPDHRQSEERVAVAQLAVGDRLIIRHGELIPADVRLLRGAARIDYSFVTGESEAVEKTGGEYLYAGGRQIGGAIEVEILKPVSQSYLTSLWNQEAFRKEPGETLDTLTNRYSERFTRIVIAIAAGAALFWLIQDSRLAVKAFASVLIVACPCALALAAPFTLGAAVRFLARRKVFLKSSQVIETMARVDSVVFDKTGTLTAAETGAIRFSGPPLETDEAGWIHALTAQSVHPHAARLHRLLPRAGGRVDHFREITGCGMEGEVSSRRIWLGSAAWLRSRNVIVPAEMGAEERANESAVHAVFDGVYRGCFHLKGALRLDTGALLRGLSGKYELALLSGDRDREREVFELLFGAAADLRFEQTPLGKLQFIRDVQKRGKKVMMVGDGLNDAGALRQSDVGVAVVENLSAFSPASDVIVASEMVGRLDTVLRFAKEAVGIVRLSFVISSVYNAVGVAVAAAGLLSPVVCAILMPVSSVSVVAFSTLAVSWRGVRIGLGRVGSREI